MLDQPPLSYEYHVILGRPARAEVLLLPGEGGWRLPNFFTAERRSWQDVGHVNWAIADRYAATVDTLRCAAIDYERESELLSKVYAAALRDPAWCPPEGAIWAGRAELSAIPLALPRQRDVIAEWFDWYAERVPTPASRAPWYKLGWHARADAWVRTTLESLGIALIGPVEHLRSWQRSATLRAPTERGDVSFKAVPAMFGHEPALTAALAASDPARIAAPLAIDPARGWMLTPAVPGHSLDEQPEIELWEAALRSFAELQIASVARLADLRAAGVPDRPLSQLAAQIGPLIADVAATLPGRPAGLSDEHRAALADLAPRFYEMCAELERYGLPPTIEHGDFWAGQIIAGPNGFTFLDWSDSSISHPFFSLLLFLIEIEDHFPKVPSVRERLRDAYLDPWATHVPRPQLERAFELAQPLAALHHAITYQQVVLPNMEVAWEMELMLPFYLKMLLRLTA
ncbi:aminoglycoside phosphotransferase family protein [Chloroflexales bacterium ZM16-3]|nr:aminoglycoside phosphotransferase family protein [Chloroflexales bacterium ZM16-3]